MTGLTTAISDSILTGSALKCMSRQWDRAGTQRELQAAPVHPGIVQVRIQIGTNSWGTESPALWASVAALNHLFTNIWSTLVFSLIRRVYCRNVSSPGVLKTLDALCSSGDQTLTIIHQPVGIGQDTRPQRSPRNVKADFTLFYPRNGPSKMW